MGRIDLRKMETASQLLACEAEGADEVRVRLERLIAEKSRVNKVDGAKDARHCGSADRLPAADIAEAAEILVQEAAALKRASESLQKAVQIYRRAEKRVVEIYQGEYRIVPRTRFGTSHFGNLSPFKSMMPIRVEELPAQTEDGKVEDKAAAFPYRMDLKKIL